MKIVSNWKLRFLTSIIVGIIIVRISLYLIRDVPISFGEITVVIFLLIVVVGLFILASLVNYLINRKF